MSEECYAPQYINDRDSQYFSMIKDLSSFNKDIHHSLLLPWFLGLRRFLDLHTKSFWSIKTIVFCCFLKITKNMFNVRYKLVDRNKVKIQTSSASSTNAMTCALIRLFLDCITLKDPGPFSCPVLCNQPAVSTCMEKIKPTIWSNDGKRVPLEPHSGEKKPQGSRFIRTEPLNVSTRNTVTLT